MESTDDQDAASEAVFLKQELELVKLQVEEQAALLEEVTTCTWKTHRNA